MNIGLLQFNPLWGEKQQNLDKIRKYITEYKNVDLWILPELCTTGYQFIDKKEVAELAEEFPMGYTGNYFETLSKEANTAIIAGVAEQNSGKFFNSAIVYDKGQFLGSYQKVHLFFEEKKWFSAGKKTSEIFTICGVRVGVMVCFDWIFPEMARSLALQNMQLLAHCANLVLPFCQDAMITRSIENKIFTATANRIGTEKRNSGSLTFTGKSQVTSPDGQRLGSLSIDKEEVLVLEIDTRESDDKNVTTFNHLFKDRKPEVYNIN